MLIFFALYGNRKGASSYSFMCIKLFFLLVLCMAFICIVLYIFTCLYSHYLEYMLLGTAWPSRLHGPSRITRSRCKLLCKLESSYFEVIKGEVSLLLLLDGMLSNHMVNYQYLNPFTPKI